ncbi:lactonase family protein [Herbiconiux sp. A18JL235]|uniref:Lactonase family protein n=1 Tax=Herbiconiux sp. A18JL235 TaxID=3152363 RepID=A0AB39BH70_9MICO
MHETTEAASPTDSRSAAILVAGRGSEGGLYRVAGSEALRMDAVADLAALCEHPRLPVVFGLSAAGGGTLLVWGLEGDAARRLAAVAIGYEEACHLAISPDGTLLVVVAYGGADGGVLRLWALDPNGVPIGDGEVVKLQGASGVDAERQDAPHPHQAVFLGDTVLVPDLGADLVRLFDVENGSLVERPGVAVPAGTGPRHLVVLGEDRSGGGVLVAVSGELSSTVLVGRLGAGVTTWKTTPSSANSEAVSRGEAGGGNYPSDIAASPDRTHVYVANRGADTVAVFEIAGDAPVLRAELTTGAAWPQHLSVTSDRMLVAWWHSSLVSVTNLVAGVPEGATRSFAVPEPGWLLERSHRS